MLNETRTELPLNDIPKNYACIIVKIVV